MPLYEYGCMECGKRTERIEKLSGPHLKKCPHCGGRVERLLSPPAIQFKGSGWYVTDYARSSSPRAAETPGSAEKSESKSESKPAEKAAAPAREKKKTRER